MKIEVMPAKNKDNGICDGRRGIDVGRRERRGRKKKGTEASRHTFGCGDSVSRPGTGVMMMAIAQARRKVGLRKLSLQLQVPVISGPTRTSEEDEKGEFDVCMPFSMSSRFLDFPSAPCVSGLRLSRPAHLDWMTLHCDD